MLEKIHEYEVSGQDIASHTQISWYLLSFRFCGRHKIHVKKIGVKHLSQIIVETLESGILFERLAKFAVRQYLQCLHYFCVWTHTKITT